MKKTCALFLIISSLLIQFSCSKSKSSNNSQRNPTLTTNSIDSITSSSVVTGGNITDVGSPGINLRGVCFGTSSNPTYGGASVTSPIGTGNGTGSFTCKITGLTANTTYYVRAFTCCDSNYLISNLTYGNQLTFTTTNIIVYNLPVLNDTMISKTSDSVIINSTITDSGSAPIIARGVCWGVYSGSFPTIAQSHTTDGTGIGNFTSNVAGLTPYTEYSARAYATNIYGTSYGNNIHFTTLSYGPCSFGYTLTVTHTAGAVAPVTKTVNYSVAQTAISGASKCWIRQNLGADHQALSFTDGSEPSAGWYWQFNRKQGYKNDGPTLTPNTTWVSSINENSDWISANDPCTLLLGTGWRIPTYTEWSNVVSSSYDVLYMHLAGWLITGSINWRGVDGENWTADQNIINNTKGVTMGVLNHNLVVENKTTAYPLRCLKD